MKKIATLFVVILLCISTTVFAYSDIDDFDVKNAVETLSLFKIINGYEDGTFKPKSNITRAEFAKIITVAMRIENIIPIGGEPFEDVSEDSWYKNYVYISKTAGIINGTSNTTFEPDANITYEQAAKMIVAALGYNQEALENGGYPEGYITVAEDLGLTDNINFENTKFATREDVALMVRKALDSNFYYLIFDGEKVERMEATSTLYELHKTTFEINEAMNNEEYEPNLQVEESLEPKIDSVG